jgi:hypothetical protein
MLFCYESVMGREASQAPIVPGCKRRGDNRIQAPVLRPGKETISFSQRVTGRPVTMKNVDLLDGWHQSAWADALPFAG